MKTSKFTALMVPKMIIIGLIAISGLGALVMVLWNALIPDIFGLTTINFWQALGLFALSHLLFSRFNHGKFKDKAHRSMHDKWKKMTPEQRRNFIKKRHDFFHHNFDEATDLTIAKEKEQ